MISAETIAQIQQAIDIADVIGDFVNLKKRGSHLMACCPFHNEKTPSFTVSPQKGFFKCFGCGKGGDAITFVREIESLSYPEALRYLARKYGIAIEEEADQSAEVQQQRQVREGLLATLDYARQQFQDWLHTHEEGRAYGYSYFRERGFTDATLATFQLGYSLDAWRGLTDAALGEGYRLDQLEAAGLTIVKDEGKAYDRFRGRVVFPIHSVAGKTIGFGARLLRKDDKQPKYLNSPETEVYRKGEVLYGIFQAKNAIRAEDTCYLVEGYTDVISLHQAGIQNVVAASGTALTEGQIKLIGRYTDNVTMLYDGDAAGQKASLRGVNLVLAAGLNVRVVAFPAGEDPDSYVRQLGGAAFRQYLADQVRDFITYKTELLLASAQQDPLRKAEVVSDIVESVSLIPDPIKRTLFYQQCSELLNVEEGVLIAEGNRLHRLAQRRENQAAQATLPAASVAAVLPSVLPPREATQRVSRAEEEREIIRLLISYAELPLAEAYPLHAYLFDETADIHFETPLYAQMLTLFRDQLGRGGVPGAELFVRHPIPEVQRVVVDMLAEADRHALCEGWEQQYKIYTPRHTDAGILDRHAYKVVLRLKKKAVQQLRAQAVETLKNLPPAETDNHLRMIMQMDETLKDIARELGTVVSG